jgi:hypothetical protein
MLTNVTAHESSPFGDPPKGDPSSEHRPAVDVSTAAMSRLRSPFDAEDDASREAGDDAQRR